MSRRKSSTSGRPVKGVIGTRRPPDCQRGGARCGTRGLRPYFVAAHAAEGLARHDVGEALHPLDGQVVRVQGDEEHRPARGHLEIGRAVRFHRHRAEDPFEREGAQPRGQVHAAAEVHRLGQDFQDQQLLDLAGPDAFHVPPAVDVRQHHLAGGLTGVRAVGRDALPGTRPHRSRLMHVRAAFVRHDRRKIAFVCPQENLLVQGHQKGRAVQGGRIVVGRFGRDPATAPRIVRAVPGGDRADVPAMVGAAVTGRVDQQQIVPAGDRFGVDEQRVVLLIAEEGRHAGPIRVHGPELMVTDLGAIHVFPARVENTPVRQDGRRVVVLEIERQGADIPALAVAAKQRADLRLPAADPALAPGGDKDDVIIRQIDRLIIIKGPARDLAEPGAVHLDLTEVVVVASRDGGTRRESSCRRSGHAGRGYCRLCRRAAC